MGCQLLKTGQLIGGKRQQCLVDLVNYVFYNSYLSVVMGMLAISRRSGSLGK